MSITLDLKADVDTYLWTSTAEAAHPSNGGVIRRWTNAIDTADKFDGSVDGSSPTYRTPTSGALLLPNADFDGSNDNIINSGDAISAYITASAWDILVAFETDNTGTNNANTYENTALFMDSGGYIGGVIKNGFFRAYNYDGTDDSVGIAASTGTAYVARMRLSGGTLYASLNGGAESSTASGNTQIITGNLRVGANYNAGHFFNGKIGRIVIANTGDELASLYAQMVADWVTGAAATFIPIVGRGPGMALAGSSGLVA